MRSLPLLAAALVFCAPTIASAFDRLVNPFGTCPHARGATEYSTIQEAVTAAASGDEIAVCPGTYEEVVNVTVAEVSIVARGHVVIRPPTVGPIEPGFNVIADDVTIRGFEITGFVGALILAGNRASVQANRFLDVVLGIDITGSGHRIANNVIRLSPGGDAAIANRRLSDGVDALVIFGNRISVSDNQSLGAGVAIDLLGPTGAQIHHNLVFDIAQGINLYGTFGRNCIGNAVRNNTIRNTLGGIGVVGCDETVVRQNAIMHSEQFGITILDDRFTGKLSTNCGVGFNAVAFSGDIGINLRGVSDCVIERNIVTRNTGTACMWDGSGVNTFSRNTCVSEDPRGAWD
jgi:parallel beta-helix repeat protein